MQGLLGVWGEGRLCVCSLEIRLIYGSSLHPTSDGFVSFNEWRKYIEDAETAAAAQEQLYYQELQRGGGGKKVGGGGGRRK